MRGREVMRPLRHWLGAATRRAYRWSTVDRWSAARRRSARGDASRARGLILVYHRLGPGAGRPHHIVPTLPLDAFRAQIDLLRTVGELLPLADFPQVLRDRDPARPCFGISFDDDCAGHVEHALPVLRELAVPATFFLSGRRLHGLGPYWWERLESGIRRLGVPAIARLLRVRAANPQQLAHECERRGLASEIEARLAAHDTAHEQEHDTEKEHAGMSADEIRALRAGGMTIGFHTLEHPLLLGVAAGTIERALSSGREALERAIAHPIDLVAYPHGRADPHAARVARALGYRAAFTCSARPLELDSDPHWLSRWEPPQQRDDAAFRDGLAWCLSRRPVAPAP